MCGELDDDFLKIAKQYSINAGSTLLMSLIQNGTISLANLGDSCGFILKDNGTMRKVTVD